MGVSRSRIAFLVMLIGLMLMVFTRASYAQPAAESAADVAVKDDVPTNVCVIDVLMSAGPVVFDGEVDGKALVIHYENGEPRLTFGTSTIDNIAVTYREDVNRIEIIGMRDGAEIRISMFMTEHEGQNLLTLQTTDAFGHDGATYTFDTVLEVVRLAKCRCWGKGGSTGVCTIADCTNNIECGTRPPGAGHNAICQNRGATDPITTSTTGSSPRGK